MGIHVQNDASQESQGEEALKEALKEHYEFTQIRTIWNAEGMSEENRDEGPASLSVQDLSQKQLAGCVLTKQTDHQQLSSGCFILHVFRKLAQSRYLTSSAT